MRARSRCGNLPQPEERTWRHVSVLAVFLGALAIRVLHIDRPPFWDEMYHILAARSLLEHGTLSLVAGGDPYTRASWYTHAVSWMFRLFGESVVAARIPAVVPGAALVAAMFAWVRKAADARSAWIVALLLGLGPLAITTSQLYRFYAVHALLFWISAACVFRLTSGSFGRTHLAAGWILIVGSLTIAWHLHKPLTILGGLALVGWVGLVLGPCLARRLAQSRYRVWLGLLVVLLLGYGIGMLLEPPEALVDLWQRYQDTAVWGTERADRPTYYHGELLGLYPTLWTLFPLLVLVAVAEHVRISLFATWVFGVVFVALSLGAEKAMRYFYFATPAFFLVSAIALAHGVPTIREHLVHAMSRVARPRLSPGAHRAVAWALGIAVLAFAIGSNRAFVHSARLILTPSSATYGVQPDWPAAATWLRASGDTSARVLSSAPLKALYYLGRIDVSLDSRQLEGRPDFGEDRWLAKPVIGTPHSLERIMACTSRGVVLIEDWHWKRPWYVPTAVADYLQEHAERVSAPPAWKLRIFRWDHAIRVPAEECVSLPVR